MELRDYITVFNRSKVFIILGTLIVVGVTALFTALNRTSYETTTTITVERSSSDLQSGAPYYTYDGYYNIQSSGFFADTIVNLMQSPSVVQSIFSRAHVDLPSVRTVSMLGKIFTVRKSPPATVSISYKSGDQDQAKTLLSAATIEMQQQAKELTSENGATFNIYATSPVSSAIIPFWALNMSLAVIVGIVLTTFISLFNHYLHGKNN